MKIQKAKFEISCQNFKNCPQENIPEIAFIGRSNVGKSSLINMLSSQKNLAKTSNKPGKTNLINYFIINDDSNNYWKIVDLPGYGYAKVSKKQRKDWIKILSEYFLKRKQLKFIFVLIDSRLCPQDIDLEFIFWLLVNKLQFALIFTKIDKISKNKLQNNIQEYKKEFKKKIKNFPIFFTSSIKEKQGQNDILNFIDRILKK